MSAAQADRLPCGCYPPYCRSHIENFRHTDEQLKTALRYAKEKLQFYRAQHSGEYVGGIEYTALIRLIDEALRG